MKIDKQLLLDDYLKWVDEVVEHADWKTHFTPKEIIDQVGHMVSTNKYYSSAIKDLVKIEKETEFKYLVKSESGKTVGIFVCDINGYYYFKSIGNGYWESNVLHAIAFHLKDLNKDLNQEMTSYFT